MRDSELLQKAARAIGYEPLGASVDGFEVWVNSADDGNSRKVWNPLEDDGDAFRLMIDMEVDVDHWSTRVHALSCATEAAVQVSEVLDPGVDRAAATRRAIVRAAIEAGRC